MMMRASEQTTQTNNSVPRASFTWNATPMCFIGPKEPEWQPTQQPDGSNYIVLVNWTRDFLFIKYDSTTL